MTAPVLADALGPRARRRVAVASAASAVVLAALAVVAVRRLSAEGQLDAELWRPFTEWEVLRFFLGGLANTLRAALAGMVGAVALGALLALGRLSRAAPVRFAAGAFVEFFRGFPLLLLILFSAFGLRRLGLDVSLFWYLVLGLAVYNGAVLGEIFRAGILSLDRGQSEAAYAVGLTYWQAMGAVVLPQALRRMVPAIVSQLVTLLKDTALGYFILYDELLRRAQIAGQFDNNLLQSLVFVALVYVAVNYALSRLAARLEVRQRRRYGASPVAATAGPEDLAVLEVEVGAVAAPPPARR